MKICLLCYRGNKYCGGQGIYLYYLARELQRLGHEVDVIVGPPYPDIPEGVRAHKLDSLNLYDRRHDGRSILEFNSPYDMLKPINLFEFGGARLGMFPEIFTFSVKAYMKIRELALSGHRYDVIHDNQCLAYGLLMMKTLGIPVVATIHHPLPIDTRAELAQETSSWKRFRQLILYPPFMQGIVSRRMDAVITDSESSVGEIRREFRIADDKLHIAYCGVDTQIFRNGNGHHSMGDNGHGRLIVVGRTSDRKKGILFLLKALRILKDEGVKVKLTVVDEVELNEAYAPDLIKRFDIEDMVTFTGRVSNFELVNYYASSDIAITASVYEGFGLPAAEAMSCGVPVITTSAGALPEVVGTDGESGLLVPPQDPRALADAIGRLIGDIEMRKRLGSGGRQRILERFTWEQCARKCVEVYEGVIAAQKR
ncbi:MAG: glycosyltransferase family 4 protein [Chloroflexota bacterium]|nr:glycosyltransferase family 4 protein [Chloroflexota bacterium]